MNERMNLVVVAGNTWQQLSQLKHGGNDTTSSCPYSFATANIIPITPLHISPYFNMYHSIRPLASESLARYATNSAKNVL